MQTTTIRSTAAKPSPSVRAPWLLALFAGTIALGGCAAPVEPGPAEHVGEAEAALSTVGKQYSFGNAALPGQCLDIEYGYTDDSMPAITWSCSGSANQRFSLIPVQGDFGAGATPRYYVWAQHSGKCLDVEYGSNSPGARIIQYHCTQAVNQIFHLEPAGTGVSQLVAQGSGLCAASDGNGGVVQMPCKPATPSQQWNLIRSTAPSVTLYRDVGYEGPSLTVSGDMPNLDLPGQSYTGVASSLIVSGDVAVTLYSGPSYTGTCHVVRPYQQTEPDLSVTPIGVDAIASLRMGDFCPKHVIRWDDNAVSASESALLYASTDGQWQARSVSSRDGYGYFDFSPGSHVNVSVKMYGATVCEASVDPWHDHEVGLYWSGAAVGVTVDGWWCTN